MRRVTFVLTHLTYGGAETQVVELARHVRRAGWAPSIVTLMPPTGLTDVLDAEGIPWVELGARRGQWSPVVVERLRRELRRLRPDVLHSHTLPANFVSRVVRPLLRVPVLITSAHNVDEGGWAKMLFYRLTDRVADLTTNCSEAAVARYVDVGAAPRDRIRHMTNGIDTERFRPDPARRAAKREALGLGQAFTWLAIGRMSAQKDWPTLLDAAVQAVGPDDRVLVVGYGELDDAVRRGIAERGLGDRVIHLGKRTDIPDLMRAADAYVMSSAWEGLPIVLLEACASGLPIVATEVGGNAQLVVPQETGLLVPARDPEALAAAMQEVRALPDAARIAWGRAGRARVEATSSMQAVARQWLALYDELLHARKAA